MSDDVDLEVSNAPDFSATSQRHPGFRNLEDRSYKTYKTRLMTTERLRRTGKLWSIAQTAVSTALITVSIALLVKGHAGDASWSAIMVILSVISLVISIVVASQEYFVRAERMQRNYRAIQSLSVRAETEAKEKGDVSRETLTQLQREYDALLDVSENQISADYWIAQESPETSGLKKCWIRTLAYVPPLVIPALLSVASLLAVGFTLFTLYPG